MCGKRKEEEARAACCSHRWSKEECAVIQYLAFFFLSLSPMLQGGRNQFGEPSVAAAACFFKALRCKKQLGPLRRCWRRRRNRFRRRREGGGGGRRHQQMLLCLRFPNCCVEEVCQEKKGEERRAGQFIHTFFLKTQQQQIDQKKVGDEKKWGELGLWMLQATKYLLICVKMNSFKGYFGDSKSCFLFYISFGGTYDKFFFL